jgi:hypothetical protein
MDSFRQRAQKRRAEYRRAVLTTMLEHGPSTAGDLARATGLSFPTAKALILEMHDRGLVDLAAPKPGPRGPKARSYAVSLAALRVTVAVHRSGELVAATADPAVRGPVITEPFSGDLPDVTSIEEALAMAACAAGFEPGTARHAVVGVSPRAQPGVLSRILDLSDELQNRLGHSVEVRRHSELSALAEARLGVARDVSDFVLVTGSPATVTHVVNGVPRGGAHCLAGAVTLLADHLLKKDVATALAAACLTVDPGLVVLGRDVPPRLVTALRELLPEPLQLVASAVTDDAALQGAVQLAHSKACAAYLSEAAKI